ncbi:heavy metal translocating P-type ATPase [Prosthecochloris sp.]|uniref:heavy metal translocating P-type ATPase n=1 Tax=Prosthecochloris sp. TaxID=290513 RepID=UPI00257D79C7|nr:heavy metal translocating P-type ATPase [Prosthecochloris sp.]
MSETETRGSETVHCDHCLLEMKPESAVSADFDGETKYFCCHGCLGVYELIHRESLDTFYNSRCGWTPGPPEKAKVEPAAFRESVRTAGTTSSLDMMLSGIRCASCVWLVEKFLLKMDGVLSARVNYATHRMTIEWDESKIALRKILEGIRSIGYVPHPYHKIAFNEAMRHEKDDLLLRFGTAAFFSMQLMLFVAALYAGFFQGIEEEYRQTFQIISWVLATPVLFYSGYPFLKNAVRSMLNRALNMDVLIALGSFSAYAYSVVMIFRGGEVYFDTSAMIVTFILLGRFLEAGSRLKAGDTLTSLIAMQPKEARLVMEKGQTVMIPLDEINQGDTIEVLAGEKIPLDGSILEGGSEVDESMLTGESTPSFKSKGKEVFAGTISLNGRLSVRVSGTEDDTVLSKIIQTVEDAQSRKAPVQAVADRVAGYFVPVVVLFAVSAFLYWKLTTADTAVALMNAVSVLVVACPCALGLATPLAVLLGTSTAAKKGVVVKGGDIFETISGTNSVVLDKTGTITSGNPSVTDVVSMMKREELLRFAASLEKYSEHPSGKAIVQAYKGDVFDVTGFTVVPGKGVVGTVNGKSGLAGNRVFMLESDVFLSREAEDAFTMFTREGKTVVFIAIDGSLAGIIGLIDDIRDDAAALVDALKKNKVHVSMLTGDTLNVARYVAAQCGIEDIKAGLNPVEKAVEVQAIRSKGNTVMMVGDGINDAPALTEADTGVTLGHASDIALESAGVVIIKDNLNLIASLIDGSRRCFAIIRQNLFWAFSYNLIALPLAIGGYLHPIMSAFLMASSSLVVVANALRLRKF